MTANRPGYTLTAEAETPPPREVRRYARILDRVARLSFVRWVALGSVVLFWIATQTAIKNVERELDLLGLEGVRDPFWAITQLNVETNRFLSSVSRYQVGKIEEAELQQRFDLLWSRANTIDQGLLYTTYLESNIDLEAHNRMRALLEFYEALMSDADALSKADLWALYEDFDASRAEIHDLGIEVLHAEATLRNARSSQLRDFLTDAGRMSNMLLVFLLLLVFVFAVDTARMRLLLRGNEGLLRETRAASDAKSQFISVVSHELRTPLTSITGSIKLLLGGGGGDLSDTARNLLTIANRNATQLARIIEDLLDIEKLEQGGDKLNREAIDLTRIADHAMQTFEALARQKDITLTGDIDRDVTFFGDASRLSRVLDNLLSNAMKFTPGGGEVSLTLRKLSDGLRIEVRDTGIGIAPDQLEKVFERFHQVDGTDQRKLGGAGLGLAIARTIVKLHGGAIRVESTLGEGTTFLVDLPKAMA